MCLNSWWTWSSTSSFQIASPVSWLNWHSQCQGLKVAACSRGTWNTVCINTLLMKWIWKSFWVVLEKKKQPPTAGSSIFGFSYPCFHGSWEILMWEKYLYFSLWKITQQKTLQLYQYRVRFRITLRKSIIGSTFRKENGTYEDMFHLHMTSQSICYLYIVLSKHILPKGKVSLRNN